MGKKRGVYPAAGSSKKDFKPKPSCALNIWGFHQSQIYRKHPIGKAMMEVLAEWIEEYNLSPDVMESIMIAYDKAMSDCLKVVSTKMSFQAERLYSYSYFDDTWTFILKNVEFREVNFVCKTPWLRITAVDSRYLDRKALPASSLESSEAKGSLACLPSTSTQKSDPTTATEKNHELTDDPTGLLTDFGTTIFDYTLGDSMDALNIGGLDIDGIKSGGLDEDTDFGFDADKEDSDEDYTVESNSDSD